MHPLLMLIAFFIVTAFSGGVACAAGEPGGIATGDWVNKHFVDFTEDDWPDSVDSPNLAGQTGYKKDLSTSTSDVKILTGVEGVEQSGNTPGYVQRKYIKLGSGFDVSGDGTLTVNFNQRPDKDDGVVADNTTGITNRYAECSTAAGTAAKTASIQAGTLILEKGARVTVNFTNANTAANPTLKITNGNNPVEKPIYHAGVAINANNASLLSGVVDLVYDGTTAWHLVGRYVNVYEQTSSGTQSDANDVSNYSSTNTKGRIVSNVAVDNATQKVKVTLDNVKIPVGSATSDNNYAQIWVEN